MTALRRRRLAVLLMVALLMGAATVLIGALPTYQQVGVWAGILLVIVRALTAPCPAPAGLSESVRALLAAQVRVR